MDLLVDAALQLVLDSDLKSFIRHGTAGAVLGFLVFNLANASRSEGVDRVATLVVIGAVASLFEAFQLFAGYFVEWAGEFSPLDVLYTLAGAVLVIRR